MAHQSWPARYGSIDTDTGDTWRYPICSVAIPREYPKIRQQKKIGYLQKSVEKSHLFISSKVHHLTCFDVEPMPSEKSLGIILVMDFDNERGNDGTIGETKRWKVWHLPITSHNHDIYIYIYIWSYFWDHYIWSYFWAYQIYPCLSKLPKYYLLWSPKYKSPRPQTTNMFVVVVGWEWDPVFMDCDIHQRILTSIITYQPTGVLNTAHLYPFVFVLVFLLFVLVLVIVFVAVVVVVLRSIIPIPTELADSRGSYCHAPQQQGAPFWWKGTCSQKNQILFHLWGACRKHIAKHQTQCPLT